MPDMNLGDALIDDGRWTVDVTHRSRSDATNDDGYATHSDGSDTTIEAVLRPEGARTWKQLPEGRADNAEWLMIVKDMHGVEQGDRIQYDSEWYEVGSVEEVGRTLADNFSMYVLEKP